MAIKTSANRLRFTTPFETFISQQMQLNGIELLPITIAHTAQIITLPFHHRDPFDRLLIAQSIVEDIPLISVDAIFDMYPVRRFW